MCRDTPHAHAALLMFYYPCRIFRFSASNSSLVRRPESRKCPSSWSCASLSFPPLAAGACWFAGGWYCGVCGGWYLGAWYFGVFGGLDLGALFCFPSACC